MVRCGCDGQRSGCGSRWDRAVSARQTQEAHQDISPNDAESVLLDRVYQHDTLHPACVGCTKIILWCRHRQQHFFSNLTTTKSNNGRQNAALNISTVASAYTDAHTRRPPWTVHFTRKNDTRTPPKQKAEITAGPAPALYVYMRMRRDLRVRINPPPLRQ